MIQWIRLVFQQCSNELKCLTVGFGSSVFYALDTTTGTCANQPRVNPLRGVVFVIGMPVENILGTGANTSYITQTQLAHSRPWQLECLGQVRDRHSGPHWDVVIKMSQQGTWGEHRINDVFDLHGHRQEPLAYVLHFATAVNFNKHTAEVSFINAGLCISERKQRERGAGDIKRARFISRGDTQRQVKLPLVRKQREGEGTKNTAVRNSTDPLTSWRSSHCVVNTE